MDYVKREILKLIKEHNGKKNARLEAEKWFQDALNSRKDNTVEKYSKPFQVGKIYVFEYTNPLTQETLEWWDKHPVVLALPPINETTDCGINLNLLPTKFKEDFLDNFYKRFGPSIHSAESGAKKDSAIKQMPLRMLRYETVVKYLDQFGFGFAVRRYKVTRKKNQAVVSYESWPKIALCDFIKLNGMSVMSLRREFNKYYNNKNI